MNTMDTTNKQVLKAMKDMMDKTASKSTFTLHELKDNGLVYISHFGDKSNAKTYARKYADESSTIYIYESRCIRIYDPVTDEMKPDIDMILCDDDLDTDYSPETDFTNMTLWKYGKGYLLEPPEDSEYYGKKYFHDGWWNEMQKGWFFKASKYDWLVSHGAIKSEYNEDSIDLSNMTLWSYGKGYLLEPQEDSEYYGDKYFYNGWWNKTQNGWFFKKDAYEWLVNNGVVKAEHDAEDIVHVEDDEDDEVDEEDDEVNEEVDEEDDEEVDEVDEEDDEVDEEDDEEDDDEEFVDDEVDEEHDYSDMTIRKYGKGFLLMPPKSHELYGEKYLCNGWWIPSQKGWFFKTEHKEWLDSCGAKMSKKVKTSKTFNVDTDLTGMSLEIYGKGYILKTIKKDNRFGMKYFMNGFWNKTQKGWFFQSKYYDDLISMGATLIKTEDDVQEAPEDSMVLTSSITEDEFEYLHDDSEFMTNDNMVVPKFIKYGKGWILKADEHYKYNENKYLEGGWWVPSIKGWFFKNKAKKEFMNKYFDI